MELASIPLTLLPGNNVQTLLLFNLLFYVDMFSGDI